MRLLQTLKLSHKFTTIHSKTSVVFVVLFGLLFSSVVAFSISLTSSQNEMLKNYLDTTSDKVLVKVSPCQGTYVNNACEKPETYDENAHKLAKKYHGDFIGAVITYVSDNNETFSVIPNKVLGYLDVEPSYYAPDDKLPIIVSEGFSGQIDDNLYELGKFSGNENDFYVILDNTSKLQDYILLNNYTVQYYEPLIVFDKHEDAYSFYNSEPNIKEILTGTFAVKDDFKDKFVATKKMFIAFAIIATMTIIIMLIFLYKNDEKIISLYRSLGAVKRDIIIIYSISIIEELIYMAAIAIIIGNIAGPLIR